MKERDEILKSVGFTDVFIEKLHEHESVIQKSTSGISVDSINYDFVVFKTVDYSGPVFINQQDNTNYNKFNN